MNRITATKTKHFSTAFMLIFGFLAFTFSSCEREMDELEPTSFPQIPEVFIDGFSPGLNYAAFGNSVPAAFDVDNEVTYANSEASMKFMVPDANSPEGAYAGGCFYTSSARDLSVFTALTFYIKATQPASIDVLGFGNDLGENKYMVSLDNVVVNTNWKKVIIPLPAPAKLKAERGMFFYSEGPENDQGYTFWIDEVKFEKINTIAHPRFSIFDGNTITESSFSGISKPITGLGSTFNMPNGVDQSVNISAAYFDIQSSDESIAKLGSDGNINIIGGPGTTEITASINGVTAEGKLILNSMGAFLNAPTPVHPSSVVISVFSDHYSNVPVNYYNGYWAPYQTTESADFEVGGDNVLYYTNFNFVGVEFTAPTINASSMNFLHIDIYIPSTLSGDAILKLEIVDNGSGGTGEYLSTITASQSQSWISLDIPLSSFTGLTDRSQLAQLIFSTTTDNIPGFYADNIYFHQ